jgi:hypothetical protein
MIEYGVRRGKEVEKGSTDDGNENKNAEGLA